MRGVSYTLAISIRYLVLRKSKLRWVSAGYSDRGGVPLLTGVYCRLILRFSDGRVGFPCRTASLGFL
jgi:hypothetical protein